MKTLAPVLAVVCCIYVSSTKAQNLSIPCGTSITTDGIVHPKEWADADSVQIDIQGNRKVIVLCKHDDSQLYFAFLGHLQSSMARFPEIMIDTDHSRGTAWDNKDWWFHLSATDCEYQGAHSTYDSCAIERPNWKGAPNIPAGLPEPPFIDTMEISIPISTLGSLSDSFGIAFDVTNTFNLWEYWPASANINTPNTWATATLASCDPAALEPSKSLSFDVFPNPSHGSVTIQFQKLVAGSGTIQVYNTLGSLITTIVVSEGTENLQVNTSEWPKGHYLMVHEHRHALGSQILEIW